MSTLERSGLSEFDRALIAATQGGLPLVARPYEAVGALLGVSGEAVQEHLERMLAQGLIRRIGAVPNHYRLGFTANGMSVWDVADEHVDELGARVGQLPFVSTATAGRAARRCGRTTCSPCCTAARALRSRPRRSRWPRCWTMPAAPTTFFIRPQSSRKPVCASPKAKDQGCESTNTGSISRTPNRPGSGPPPAAAAAQARPAPS